MNRSTDRIVHPMPPHIDPASLYKSNMHLRNDLDQLSRVVDSLVLRVIELENTRKPRSEKHAELDSQIMSIFEESPKLLFNRQAIAQNLDMHESNSAQYHLVVRRLNALHAAGRITLTNGNTSYPRYQLA
jgi:hypothetical protein